jgi:hypothetical protein
MTHVGPYVGDAEYPAHTAMLYPQLWSCGVVVVLVRASPPSASLSNKRTEATQMIKTVEMRT